MDETPPHGITRPCQPKWSLFPDPRLDAILERATEDYDADLPSSYAVDHDDTEPLQRGSDYAGLPNADCLGATPGGSGRFNLLHMTFRVYVPNEYALSDDLAQKWATWMEGVVTTGFEAIQEVITEAHPFAPLQFEWGL